MSVTLYESASFAEHSEFTQHLTAEKQIEKFIPVRGEVIVWERIDRKNHWLDSTYAALCAGEAVRDSGAKTERKKPLSLKQMAGAQK